MGLSIETMTPQGMAVQAGMGIVSDVIGQVGQKRRNDRAFRQQKELMEIQQQNQMKLNQQGKDLAYQQWKDTNYNAQRKELERAGLNAGLLYGMSGGGGTTANAGSGGSAASGQAPAQQPMDINAINNMATLAQIELTKSLTKKADAEAEKTAGTDTENVKANTALTNMNEANATIQNEIGTMTMEAVIKQISANANIALSEARTADTRADVNAATKNEQIDKIKTEASNAVLQGILMKADTSLTNEKARAITVELAQEWERLSIEIDKVGVGKMQNAINEFTAKVNARLGQGNLDMRKIEAGIEATGKLLGRTKIDARGDKNTTVNNY